MCRDHPATKGEEDQEACVRGLARQGGDGKVASSWSPTRRGCRRWDGGGELSPTYFGSVFLLLGYPCLPPMASLPLLGDLSVTATIPGSSEAQPVLLFLSSGRQPQAHHSGTPIFRLRSLNAHSNAVGRFCYRISMNEDTETQQNEITGSRSSSSLSAARLPRESQAWLPCHS